MDKYHKKDAMSVNISNVFSPVKSVHHMSDQVYDVDYTATSDAPIENHEDKEIFDRLEKTGFNVTRDK